MPEPIEYCKLKNGLTGIMVGTEDQFLEVQHTEGKWRLRLYDMHGGRTPLTGGYTFNDIEDLRSYRAKALKELLGKNLEQVIGKIQDNEEKWKKETAEETEPSQEEQQLWEEARTEAQDILASPDVLERLKPHLDNVVAGEDDNKLLALILLKGGRTYPQTILLKGDAGAGKTQLAKLADAFKTKTVGRFSAHALDYTDLSQYEILSLKELGDMDQEFQGVSTIKFLSADDKGYTVEVTVRDEEGHFTTDTHKIPPITVLTTTTRVAIDPQFERRAWILNLDETEEQTEKVRRWKANHEREKNEVAVGLRTETSYEHSMRVLKAVVESAENVSVVIPFPDSLTSILGIEKLRLRGDYDKFYGLVKLYGLLHQNTLPHITGRNSHEAILVVPEHAFRALKIAEKPYATMASELEERSRKLIAKMKEQGLTHAGDAITMDERGKVAVALGKSETTVKHYFDDWERAGYVNRTESKGRGTPHTYHLLYDLNVIEQKVSVSFNIDKLSEEKGLKFAEEAESFLKRLPTNGQWETIMEQFYVGISQKTFVGRQRKEELSVTEEKKQLSSDNSQTLEDTAVSEQLEPSVQEAVEYARGMMEKRLPAKTTQDDFKHDLKFKGLPDWKAEEAIEKLFEEGEIAIDPDGWLVWVRE